MAEGHISILLTVKARTLVRGLRALAPFPGALGPIALVGYTSSFLLQCLAGTVVKLYFIGAPHGGPMIPDGLKAILLCPQGTVT